jgi:ketosteroid isomerase-like protein
MKKTLGVSLALSIGLMGFQPAIGAVEGQTPDLDAFWGELSRTVAEGDFQGYAATYHPDAILVSGPSETSYPISEALDGWKQGFTDTKAGKMEAGVEFRFTSRLSDGATAHETGMFHYWVVNADGQRTDQIVHFEALLIRKDGWKMMMEYQKSPATQAEWEAAG